MTDKKDNNEWASNFPTSETKKVTTIILRDNEAALVMDSDGNVSIYFPNMDDDGADVPDHIQFVSALATVCTSDEEVIELIWERFHKLVDEVN